MRNDFIQMDVDVKIPSMKYMDYARKLEALKYLAAHKQTGTPRSLAEKLEVSERTAERMVQQLRDDGIPIRYNRFRSSYEIVEGN